MKEAIKTQLKVSFEYKILSHLVTDGRKLFEKQWLCAPILRIDLRIGVGDIGGISMWTPQPGLEMTHSSQIFFSSGRFHFSYKNWCICSLMFNVIKININELVCLHISGHLWTNSMEEVCALLLLAKNTYCQSLAMHQQSDVWRWRQTCCPLKLLIATS